MNQKDDKSKSIKNRSKRGGKRPGSGRKRGTPNKLTFELKKAASEYGEEVLDALVRIIRNKETPSAVIVTACRELLDRGFGRPAVTVEATVSGKLEPELLHRLETEMIECMERSRQRQQAVLVERGIIGTDDNELRRH